jgi:hypothetical protein
MRATHMPVSEKHCILLMVRDVSLVGLTLPSTTMLEGF